MERKRRAGLILGFASLAALALGVLIFFEIIRPFHDGNIDMPIAIGAGVVGALLSFGGLVLRKGAVILNAIALLLNVLALIAVALIAWSLSHMRLI